MLSYPIVAVVATNTAARSAPQVIGRSTAASDYAGATILSGMNLGGPGAFDVIPVRTTPDQPLAVELCSPPDPWEVARRVGFLPHLLFLDSAEQHPERGRYSYVAADPVCWVDERREGIPAAPFAVVNALLGPRRIDSLEGLPPFQGGVAGLFGYGLNRRLEPRVPTNRHDEFRVPDIALGLYDWVISFDHRTGRAWVVSTGLTGEASQDRASRRARAEARLWDVLNILKVVAVPNHRPAATPGSGGDIPPRCLAPQYPLPGHPGVTSNFDRRGYEAVVRKGRDYVHAGDCFQVNLSQRLLCPLREDPRELYGRLRRLNPAPFAGFFDLGDFQVLSASPERFLQLRADGEVVTRPIKGTRPRGADRAADEALIRSLTTNPKDRAENVMIVDLLRNDLGRVCEYGTVRVPRVCEVETFRYVHHLVSEVRGRLRAGLGPADLLAAAFPGGSVTGAPKVRAMEIIAELEPTARGPYCGSLAWVGFDGRMDTNILIRTFTAGRGWIQFPVGGGVVADSEPDREYEETLHKAAGLLRSLDLRGTAG